MIYTVIHEYTILFDIDSVDARVGMFLSYK